MNLKTKGNKIAKRYEMINFLKMGGLGVGEEMQSTVGHAECICNRSEYLGKSSCQNIL